MWGLYWRYLISISLSIMLLAWVDGQIAWLDSAIATNLKPTLFWGILTIVFAAFTVLQNKGMAYLFWGRKLSLNTQVWRTFNGLIIMFLVALSLLGYLVNNVAAEQVWELYKLYAQPACLILCPLCAAWFVTKRSKT